MSGDCSVCAVNACFDVRSIRVHKHNVDDTPVMRPPRRSLMHFYSCFSSAVETAIVYSDFATASITNNRGLCVARTFDTSSVTKCRLNVTIII